MSRLQLSVICQISNPYLVVCHFRQLQADESRENSKSMESVAVTLSNPVLRSLQQEAGTMAGLRWAQWTCNFSALHCGCFVVYYSAAGGGNHAWAQVGWRSLCGCMWVRPWVLFGLYLPGARQ